MPAASQPRTSQTVMPSPLMQGWPERFSGSIVILGLTMEAYHRPSNTDRLPKVYHSLNPDRGGNMVRLLILIVIATGAAFAQTAEITGRVIDASGAVVPGTSIVVTNVETSV